MKKLERRPFKLRCAKIDLLSEMRLTAEELCSFT